MRIAIVILATLPGCAAAESTPQPPKGAAVAASRPPAPRSREAAQSKGAPAGSGLARDQAPPQRRFKILTVPGGGFTPFRLRIVEESDVVGMPPAPHGEARVPDPPAAEPPPDPRGPPPVIRIPAPR